MSQVSVGLSRSVLLGVLIVLLGCSDAATEFPSTSQASLASVEPNPLSDVSSSSGVSGESTGSTTSQLSSASTTAKLGSRDEARPALHSSPARPLSLPWADFAEMHEPNLDANLDGIGWPESGFLAIDGDCVYLELVDFEEPFPSEHRRIALSFPRGWTQYDSDSDEIFVHQRSGLVYGPFASDNFVSAESGMSLALSDTCDDRLILRAWDVAPCIGNYTRHGIWCPEQQYSMRYGVFPSEARQQLASIPELQGLLEQLRDIEEHRFAGWGIDRDGAEGTYLAWLWVTGSGPPSDAAQRLADEHDDVELRIGAERTYEELDQALMQFNSGSEYYLPLSDTSYLRYPQLELRSVVRRSYVDHRANRLEIAIDSLGISRPVASAVLTGNARTIANRNDVSREELEAVIGDLLTQHLGVPVKVTHSWP